MSLSDQDRNVSLDQEQPGPSLTKEEEEEICICPEGEQLALKQEPDALLLIAASQAHDHPLLPHHSDEDDKKDQKQTSVGDGTEAESVERLHKKQIYSCNIAHSSNFLVFHTYSLPLSESFEYQMCGKDFRSECRLNEHMITHTDVKPFCCDTCGKRFRRSSSLSTHGRLHSGEKPYPCKTCGKCFRRSYSLMVHMRTHTGRNHVCARSVGRISYSWALCIFTWHFTRVTSHICASYVGKDYARGHSWYTTRESTLTRGRTRVKPAVWISSAETRWRSTWDIQAKKPCSCQRCGKNYCEGLFDNPHAESLHGEKLYCCMLCGEKFSDSYSLSHTVTYRQLASHWLM